MKKAATALFLVFLFYFLSGLASAGVRIAIQARQLLEGHGSGGSPVAGKEFPIDVELGSGYFSYQIEGRKRLCDLAGKRIITICPSTGEYTDDSLYHEVGLRAFELEKSLKPSVTPAVEGPDEHSALPIYTEHLLSMEKRERDSKISERPIEGGVCFGAEGRDLFCFSQGGFEASAEERRGFVKFIRYAFGGHPQILEKLAANSVIPESISIHQFKPVEQTTTLSLASLKRIPDSSYRLDALAPGLMPEDTDGFSIFLHQVRYASPIDLEANLRAILVRADECFREGNLLDVMLAYMEYHLASSLPFPGEFQEKKAAVERDALVAKLVSALSPKGAEQAKEALSWLDDLERESISGRHVIMIFKANIHMGLGNPSEAKRLLQEALKVNPGIVGAYKDLGQLYFEASNTAQAWRCWDAARRIAPEHGMLEQIDAMEEMLQREHPEYF